MSNSDMAVLIDNPLPRYSVLFAAVFLLTAAQAQPATPPSEPDCNGILLTFNLDRRDMIRPFVPVPDAQPYSFHSTATVRNSGVRALRSWTLLLTFAHGEILVTVDGAVLTSGADLPYNTTTSGARNATSLSGYPQTDLLTPIATAGDLTKIQATVNLVGTLFAGPEPYVPLPSALSLADPSYTCPPAINVSTFLSTCCVLTPEAAANATAGDLDAARTTTYLPRGTGDMVITYDVLQAHETTYLAQVTLENDALLGRLDGWELSWEWLRGEFISSMRGAYPRQVGASDCVYGAQGSYYKGLDFSKVLNCDRKPAVLDLPSSHRDDKDVGGINHCCQNGTMMPKSVDAAQSKSAFQMEVYKMPPDLNRTKLYAPTNFKISGASPLNPEYACGQPVRVSPTEIPDPSGLASTTLALATWQVVCNMTTASAKTPSCCVTFSAFYNDSVIPCSTCACGCVAASSCSRTAPSMLLPPYALLMPFERRAREAVKWAGEKRLGVPSPMPCGDNCGVSINWHVATDYPDGWSARATLFNWEAVDMAEWYLAVEMEKQAYDGFEQAFSFNATAVGNGSSMILMRGMEGFQYLKGESNMSGVDYPVAGKQQSVLLFRKKRGGGDGFPSRVLFNGHECAMPQRIPSGANRRLVLSLSSLVFMSSIALLLSLL